MRPLLLFCSGVLAGWLAAQTVSTVPKFRHENAIAFGEAAKKANPATFSHHLATGIYGSVFIATPKDPIRAHYHAEHDETVVMVRGKGTLTIDGQTRRVLPGDVVYVPKGTVHAFLPEVGDEVLVSVFAPTFDGKDRIFVDRQP